MAIYKIFPEKDATIFSDNPYKNSGISEILDLSNGISDFYIDTPAANRIVIKFSDDDINEVVSNYIGNIPFSASLKMYLSDASTIPAKFSLNLFAVSGAWDMGTGRIDDTPIITDGVSWLNRTTDLLWLTSSYSAGSTGSFITSSMGGGTWYTSFIATQSFHERDDLNINFDVSSIVNSYVSKSIVNDGFIIKNDSSVEFNSQSYKLTYFSVDTNTIYPPCLELKWNDSIYTPDTGSMSMIGKNSVFTIGNNKGKYNKNEIVRFNINARDQYPQRTFVTSSLYTLNKYLPTSSYYSIRDLDTDNIVVDYDDQFTKISTDSDGSFFNLYMNGLEPERYYSIDIKIVSNGIKNVYNDNFYFKVLK